MFTINNPAKSDVEAITCEQNFRAIVYQFEIAPETGTPHIQGYVEFSRSMRPASVQKILGGRAYIYVRLGSQSDAVRYVTKTDTRRPGSDPMRYGTLKDECLGGHSAFEDLREALESSDQISKVAKDHFEMLMKYRCSAIWYRNLNPPKRDWKPSVDVFYGDPGTGKTRSAAEKYPSAYWLAPPNVRGGPIWFTGYEGEEDIIIDDFYGWMPWTQLLRLIDRYPMVVHVHGNVVPFLGKRIIFTSNVHPKKWYDYEKSVHMKLPALMRRIDKVTRYH